MPRKLTVDKNSADHPMPGTPVAAAIALQTASDKAVLIQREYYLQTAAQYDAMHMDEGMGNHKNLEFVRAMLQMTESQTLLDVGAGTGRVLRYFRETMPDLHTLGVEPVPALIEQAEVMNGIPAGTIVQGVGESLPFNDTSFDVVCSFGILHHVRRPEAIIREMTRVARKAVIIMDGNRFGQGMWSARLLKLALYKAGLWGALNYLKTGGKGYSITDGDGLAYSYSAYDSFDYLARWAARLIVLPSEPCKPSSWFRPLLTSPGVVVCALRETV
jgi:ubiquinone/menaquinone biosynthesis C-methylase UbiE